MADCTMIATEKRKEKCPYLLVRRVKILFSREKKKKNYPTTYKSFCLQQISNKNNFFKFVFILKYGMT